MAKYKKGSRKIVIDSTEFRWSATGNDGWITVVIWAPNKDSLKLIGTFEYHHKYVESCGGWTLKGQIIITNRVIRKIIEHVGVNKILNSKGQLNLGDLEEIYDINNALRADN